MVMERHPSHYAVLGLRDRSFTPAQLKKQYRALAKRWHPDRNRGNEATATEHFKALQEAFEVLSDIEKRRQYDASRHLSPRQAASSQGQGAECGERTPADDARSRAHREAWAKKVREEREAMETAMRSDEWVRELRRRRAAKAARDGSESMVVSDDDDEEEDDDEDEAAEIAAAVAAVERAIQEEREEEEALMAAIAASLAEQEGAEDGGGDNERSNGCGGGASTSSSSLSSRRERLACELGRCAKALLELSSEEEPIDEASAHFDAAIPTLVGLLRTGSSAGNAAWALSMLSRWSISRLISFQSPLVHASDFQRGCERSCAE